MTPGGGSASREWAKCRRKKERSSSGRGEPLGRRGRTGRCVWDSPCASSNDTEPGKLNGAEPSLDNDADEQESPLLLVNSHSGGVSHGSTGEVLPQVHQHDLNRNGTKHEEEDEGEGVREGEGEGVREGEGEGVREDEGEGVKKGEREEIKVDGTAAVRNSTQILPERENRVLPSPETLINSEPPSSPPPTTPTTPTPMTPTPTTPTPMTPTPTTPTLTPTPTTPTSRQLTNHGPSIAISSRTRLRTLHSSSELEHSPQRHKYPTRHRLQHAASIS